MESAPSKSTAGDALRDRDNEVFKLYYFTLIKYFEPLLSVSRKEKFSLEKFYAYDSTTITLFSDVMKGVGRNPKGDGKKRGGLKVHMLIDVHADTAVFAKFSEAKMHDKKFLQHLNPSKASMLVFDKAYNYYRQFAELTEEGVYFVCRLKDNAKTEIQETLFEKSLGKDENTNLSPNWDITAEEVALIYKYRWTIKTTLLLNVIRVLSKSRKAFSTLAALIRIHLISHLDLMWVVTEGKRVYTKRRISRNKSRTTVQLSLF